MSLALQTPDTLDENVAALSLPEQRAFGAIEPSKGFARMIRVLCVDDDPMVRGYLVTRLAAEPDMQVVASVADVARALIHLSYDQIDVVLLDYLLQGRDGISMVEGMAPWLNWPQDLIRAVRAVASGRCWFDHE
jgi:PleD family two-component response regulator